MAKREERTLLIDGDILAYQTAVLIEKAIPWDEDNEDLWTTHYSAEDGYARMDSQLAWLKEELKATRIVVCLSDAKNFRYDIYGKYKSNRKNTRKPFGLVQMKEYLAGRYETFIRPKLEADDVLGILATSPKFITGDKIIVSIDKDLMGIPAKVFNLNKAQKALDAGEINNLLEGVVEVTEEEADKWHLTQTLTGDITDGYTGCPSVGADKAREILNNPIKLIPYEHEVKRGNRKGEIEIRYKEGEPCSLWEAVVSQYEKAGLSEAVALEQARVARILRHTDYDYKKKEPILWTPKKK